MRCGQARSEEWVSCRRISKRDHAYDVITRRGASLSRDVSDNIAAGDWHLYGPNWETLADIDAINGTPSRLYVTAGGMDSQVAMLTLRNGASRTYCYLQDHQGSVVALIDGATGRMVEAYEYEPYGMPTVWQLADPNFPANGIAAPRRMDRSAVGNRFLYTGREWDPDVAFYHMRFRVYSPKDKRFLQSDPIKLAGGWNHYAYCEGNPVMWTDRLGLTIAIDLDMTEEDRASLQRDLDNLAKNPIFKEILNMMENNSDVLVFITNVDANKNHPDLVASASIRPSRSHRVQINIELPKNRKVWWIQSDDLKTQVVPNDKNPQIAILAHELLHGLEIMAGTESPEQTIIDGENEIREELGLPLRKGHATLP